MSDGPAVPAAAYRTILLTDKEGDRLALPVRRILSVFVDDDGTNVEVIDEHWVVRETVEEVHELILRALAE